MCWLVVADLLLPKMNAAFTVNVVYNDNMSGNVMHVKVISITSQATTADVIAFLQLPSNTVLTDDDGAAFRPQMTLASQGITASSNIFVNTSRP